MEEHSQNRSWRTDSACRSDRLSAAKTAPDLFFPYVETLTILMDVRKRFCNLCPVSIQCLDTARRLDASGIWGGTSTAERKAMNRRRTRAKCPVCSSGEPVTVDSAQVCASCGSSWERDRPKKAKAA